MKYIRRALQYSLFSLLVLVYVMPICLAQQQSNTVFRDDFTGTSLNPKWRVIAPDKDRWTLIDGEYLLIVMTKAGRNVMQFAGDLPDDYDIITKVQSPPQHENQVVRTLLRQNNENKVEISYSPKLYDPGRGFRYGIVFSKVLNGKWSNINRRVRRLGKDEPLYLKLSKRGIEYTGAYSVDGATWTNVGTHVHLNLDGKPAFDAYNYYVATVTPPESGIRFDYFEIRKVNK